MIIDEYSSIPSFSRVESIKSSNKTLLWILARTKSDLKVPSWSGFQEITTDKNVERAVVGYLPLIADSPIEMKVIYAEIEGTEKIRVELGTEFIFIEADQAIYAKVLDAMFKMRNEGKVMIERIIPRMGGFYFTICMLRTIYCIYSKIGFVQILAKAGLGGIRSLKRTLKGKDVNEAIRLHKTLFEALVRTKIGCFDIRPSDENSLKLEVYKEDINPDSTQAIISQKILPKIPAAEGDMGWFMDLYIELVNMLLNFIHFLRTRNWEGYLEVIFEFLSFCFRLNRHNSARNLGYYYAQMIALPFTNAQAHKYLRKGGFSGSLTGTPDTKIPYDQITETIINRQYKDVGGIGGIWRTLGQQNAGRGIVT